MSSYWIETILGIVAVLVFLVIGVSLLTVRIRRREARAKEQARQLQAAIAEAESEQEVETIQENAERAAAEAAYAQIQKSVRNWGLSLLVFGGLQFVASDTLSLSWGVVLVLIGLVSFVMQDVEMFVLYAGVMAFAAISNIMGGGAWIVLGVLQVIWTINLFRGYKKNRALVEKKRELERAETESWAAAEPIRTRASRFFPWAAVGVAVVGWLTLLTIVLFYLPRLPDVMWTAIDALISLGFMGIPLGLASLLARHPYKGASIVGLVGSSLLYLANLALIYL